MGAGEGGCRALLFGGALLCAGGTVASGEEFDWAGSVFSAFNLSASYAMDFLDSDPADFESFAGAGAFETSASNDYGAAWAVGAAREFRAEASSTGLAYGLGITYNYQLVRVTRDAMVSVAWDMTAYDFGFESQLRIGVYRGQMLLETGINSAGSQRVHLLAGVDYAFVSLVGAGTPPGGEAASAFIVMTIPAPGSAGLLAIAGLAGIRTGRRRD